jgi:alkanesulfonate monooxygenase SsuD/methylene tetrahydromethanopterin reductase-like flavin-dependent oxidoreductase (luciferase family)
MLEILDVARDVRRADEALRVFKAPWTQDNPAFEGEFFRFRDVGFAPTPVQKPHLPVWVGGDRPGAFRRVTLGNGWHATSKTAPQFAEALGRLRKAAPRRVCASKPSRRSKGPSVNAGFMRPMLLVRRSTR